MNNRLNLFCPKCNAWCGEFVSVAQLHFVAAHPGVELPTAQQIIEYAAQVRLKHQLRNVMAPLAALAPEEA